MLVVAPSAVAIILAVAVAGAAWAELDRTSDERVAAMVLVALDQELARSAAEAVGEALPAPDPDPQDPAVRRALAGDTITGYRASAGALEVVVVLAGTDSVIRTGTAPVQSTFVDRVSRATGYATSLYVRGTRWTGSPGAPGPEQLAQDTLLMLDGGGLGVYGGFLSAGPAPAASPPPLAVLVASGQPPQQAVARPVLLVMGLLLLFSALAGWILLARREEAGDAVPRTSMVLLALVPTLATAGLLSHVDRSYADAAWRAASRDLTRGLAVASALDAVGSPRVVRTLTGFHAARVSRGGVESSTFDVDGTAGLATLPAPPPSFTSAGRVDTPEGPSAYVGLRLREGGFTVVTTPYPTGARTGLRQRLGLVGGLLLLWMLGVAGMILAGPSRAPPRLPS